MAVQQVITDRARLVLHVDELVAPDIAVLERYSAAGDARVGDDVLTVVVVARRLPSAGLLPHQAVAIVLVAGHSAVAHNGLQLVGLVVCVIYRIRVLVQHRSALHVLDPGESPEPVIVLIVGDQIVAVSDLVQHFARVVGVLGLDDFRGGATLRSVESRLYYNDGTRLLIVYC